MFGRKQDVRFSAKHYVISNETKICNSVLYGGFGISHDDYQGFSQNFLSRNWELGYGMLEPDNIRHILGQRDQYRFGYPACPVVIIEIFGNKLT